MNKQKKREHLCHNQGWFGYKYANNYYLFHDSWHWMADHVGFKTRKAAYLWARKHCLKKQEHVKISVTCGD